MLFGGERWHKLADGGGPATIAKAFTFKAEVDGENLGSNQKARYRHGSTPSTSSSSLPLTLFKILFCSFLCLSRRVADILRRHADDIKR